MFGSFLISILQLLVSVRFPLYLSNELSEVFIYFAMFKYFL